LGRAIVNLGRGDNFLNLLLNCGGVDNLVVRVDGGSGSTDLLFIFLTVGLVGPVLASGILFVLSLGLSFSHFWYY
jgi:hypothetical protein